MYIFASGVKTLKNTIFRENRPFTFKICTRPQEWRSLKNSSIYCTLNVQSRVLTRVMNYEINFLSKGHSTFG